MEPYGDVYGGSSEFVATVALSEELPEETGASFTEVSGFQGNKLNVTSLIAE